MGSTGTGNIGLDPFFAKRETAVDLWIIICLVGLLCTMSQDNLNVNAVY